MQPAREHRLAEALGRLLRDRVEDLDLRAMPRLAGDRRKRIEVEHRKRLLVAQLEPQGDAVQNVSVQKSWFSPPKTSLTEPSVKIRRIESVSSSAQGSTKTLSGAPARSGIVSVTTIRSNCVRARFS